VTLSRREFLRLRSTDRGRVLELSCRAFYMRCADSEIEPGEAVDYDSWVGEPPLVVARRSADEIIAAFETELADAQVLRLIEPEWLDSMPGAERLNAVLDAFRQRGGRIEEGGT
jgi:hypothetical protein